MWVAFAIVFSVGAVAFATPTTVNMRSTNSPPNPIFAADGVTLLATGRFVQLIRSLDSTPGAPSPTTGAPAGDDDVRISGVIGGGASGAGGFVRSADISPISPGGSAYVYVRAWDTWNGTGVPTGNYGTSPLTLVPVVPIFTARPSSFSTNIPINPPVISLSPTSTSFTATAGGPNPAPATFVVNNTGGGMLAWTASEVPAAAWLVESPLSGGNGVTVTLTPSIAGLAGGTYTTAVRITDPAANNSPRDHSVTLTIDPALSGFEDLAAPPGPGAGISISSAEQSQSIKLVGNGFSVDGDPANAPHPGSVTVGGVAVTNTNIFWWDNSTIDIQVPASAPAGLQPVVVTVGGRTATRSITITALALPANLDVSPATLNYTAAEGGANPSAQTLTVGNSGGSSMNWASSVTTGTLAASRVTVAPASGTVAPGGSQSPAPSVSIDSSGLSAGSYSATVTITATGAVDSPITVTVNLTVTAASVPIISLTPASTTFSATAGGSNPAPATFTVTNSGGGTLSGTIAETPDATWLTVGPATLSGNNTTVTLTPNISGLVAGSYTATVRITASGASNSPQDHTVTLTVSAAASPVIVLTPTSTNFSATAGGANPIPTTFTVTNSGGGTLSGTIAETPDATWLTVGPATLSGNSTTVTLTPNISGLVAGSYTATVQITGSGAGNSPQDHTVTLTITAAPTPPAAPVITDFTEPWDPSVCVSGSEPGCRPSLNDQAAHGQTISILGSNFGDDGTPAIAPHSGTVTLGGTLISEASIFYWDNGSITFQIPSSATLGLQPVVVTVGGQSASRNITIAVSGGSSVTLTTGVALNFPNPFNPDAGQTTRVEFTLSRPGIVRAFIYSLNARLVQAININNGVSLPIGDYRDQLVWDGRDFQGNVVANGIYLLHIINLSGNEVVARGKILVIK